MDLLTLISVGPTLIRAIGSMFGGKTAEVTSGVAQVIDDIKGLPADMQRDALNEHLSKLTPEQLTALKAVEVQLAKIEQEREAARLQADTVQTQAVQQTAQVEAQSADEYVRRTRPKLARDSAAIAFIYAITTGVCFQIINALYDTKLPGVDTWIIGALYSPCLTYMGVRTIDAFSPAGKK